MLVSLVDVVECWCLIMLNCDADSFILFVSELFKMLSLCCGFVLKCFL